MAYTNLGKKNRRLRSLEKYHLDLVNCGFMPLASWMLFAQLGFILGSVTGVNHSLSGPLWPG